MTRKQELFKRIICMIHLITLNMNHAFRLSNKKILLTYPQLNEDYTAQQFGEHFKWTFQNIINFNYIIACKENHQDQGHHYHLYFESEEPFRSTNERIFDLQFQIGTYHPNIEPVKRTPWKTVDYIKKDGDFWEYLPENAPKPALENMTKSEKNKFLKEHNPLELYDDGLLTPQQCAGLLKAKELIARARIDSVKRKDPPFVLWFWGSTGSGKTRTAIEIATDMGKEYWISHSEKLQWFDGYHGQEVVIFDDFRRNMCTFNYFLRLLDRYTMQVQVKGGYVNWIPKIIIITCPVDSSTAYTYFDIKTNEEREWDNLQQLKRRITDEICFDDYI
nr:putative replicase protein [Dromedary stool-associated circular ssDNA virus]